MRDHLLGWRLGAYVEQNDHVSSLENLNCCKII